MITTVYRLVSPKRVEEFYLEEDIRGKVVVRPTRMSICSADQRYYQGNRTLDILNDKLPMALIHECIGEVVYSGVDDFVVGDCVVLIPISPVEVDDFICENYLESSVFCSSGGDGFMRDYVVLPSDRLLKIPEGVNLDVFSFVELVSVSFQAVNRFLKFYDGRCEVIGVWGDGNLGYITSLLLKTLLPDVRVFVFGVNDDKLELFSFVDETYKVNEVPDGLRVDCGSECVGGLGSQDAINQFIDIVNPMGILSILGVSEYPISINTRKILEKGLIIYGTTRSSREDFIGTINLLKENPILIEYLENIINQKITIKNTQDIIKAFDKDYNSNGKTILKWKI